MRKAMVVALLAVLGVAGCSSGGGRWNGGTSETQSSADISITPADNAKDVPVSEEIAVKVKDGKVTDVKLEGADSKAVKGEMRADGSSWVPASPLSYTTTYTATVTAKTDNGK